jgi:glycosyltransferase involved in cell wall biosynthesis
MRIVDSHEFLELYRGDKDLRMAVELTRADPTVSVVSLGPEALSPVDAARFGAKTMSELPLPPVPERVDVQLLPSRAVRFSRKESGGIMAVVPGFYGAVVRARPDVIFENPYSWLTPRSYATYLASLRTGAPVVYYDPGDDIPISRTHRIMAVWEKPVVRHASAIITYTEAGRTRFISKYGYPERQIHVIPKPIDVARWSTFPGASAIRRELGADAETLVVGYVGRLARYKGSDVLLRVATAAQDDPTLTNVLFVFVGGALASEEGDDAYRGPNRVVTGMVDNARMPDYLGALDVVVFPDITHPGGFPTALAEAMASGRAIVAGIGDRRDFLPLTDGVDALIVPPSDDAAILHAVQRLAADRELRTSMARAAGAYAASQMDYPVQAARYLEIARDAIGRVAHAGGSAGND